MKCPNCEHEFTMEEMEEEKKRREILENLAKNPTDEWTKMVRRERIRSLFVVLTLILSFVGVEYIVGWKEPRFPFGILPPLFVITCTTAAATWAVLTSRRERFKLLNSRQ